MAPFDHTDMTARTHERWKALLSERLAQHREANDGLRNDERITAITRGRIAELKELLALAKPAPASVADPAKASAYRPELGD